MALFRSIFIKVMVAFIPGLLSCQAYADSRSNDSDIDQAPNFVGTWCDVEIGESILKIEQQGSKFKIESYAGFDPSKLCNYETAYKTGSTSVISASDAKECFLVGTDDNGKEYKTPDSLVPLGEIHISKKTGNLVEYVCDEEQNCSDVIYERN